MSLSGVTLEQSNTILSLVSIAENSRTDWQANYNYVEDIGDGRGYTIDIVGFCTGTGDFLWMVENMKGSIPELDYYLPALRKVNGSASHTGLTGLPELIKGLGKDPRWIAGTWAAVNHFYWDPVLGLAKDYGLKNVVTLGQLYDMNLNAGSLRIAKKLGKPTGTEDEWLSKLQAKWLTYITKKDHSVDSGQPDRALMWKSIANNHDLTLPINVVCYRDKYLIK